jgi:hypothetical protein
MKIKVGLGIFIIVAIVVGSVILSAYRTHSASAVALGDKIKLDTLALGKISQSAKTANNQTIELNSQIQEMQDKIDAASGVILDDVNANAIIKAIYAQSTVNQVTLVPLSTQPWNQLDNNSGELRVFRISFSATGLENNLISFIQWLQNSSYSSLVVENYVLTRTVNQNGSITSASQIDMALYSK